MSDSRKARFLKALDALEDQLDKGFFLSFINKIIVDEKRIYTIINELRSMMPDHFDELRDEPPRRMPEPEPARPPGKPAFYADPTIDGANGTADEIIQKALDEAENIKRGADEYARKVLAELEEKLGRALKSVTDGRKVLDDRLS